MDTDQLVDRMIEACLEQDEQSYDAVRVAFQERVANLDSKSGVRRIQELEKIWGELNTKRKATASDAIHALLESVDEAALIESKKGNTKERV